MLGDLNEKIDQSQNLRSQKITDLLMEFGQMDLLHHFQQHLQFWETKTCYQVIQGIVMRAICDYILGTYWRRFKMVGIRGVKNYPSDHFTLRDRLLICLMEEYRHFGAGGLPEQIGPVHRGREEAGSDYMCGGTG